jgi:cytochrome b6-f complex iron-sulfur subunit
LTVEAKAPRGINKDRARRGLSRLQTLIGSLLLVSASAGIYLLATDGSLWHLALSHAAGLIVIVGVDIVLGMMNLFSSRGVYLPSLAAAVLTLALQLGDIFTAPQYNIPLTVFTSYLFGLWAFDLLLAIQFVVIALGVVGRPYAAHLARRKSRRGKELDYTRRGFVRSLTLFGGLVGAAAVLSSIKLPVSSVLQSTSTQPGTPAGAIAQLSSLKVGSPVYFEYPKGYPNMLMLMQDGSITAVSLVCTHVCCECEYVASSKVIACPCHGSVFGLSGKLLQGPASTDLPTILTTTSNGYIYPTGVSSPGPCQV